MIRSIRSARSTDDMAFGEVTGGPHASRELLGTLRTLAPGGLALGIIAVSLVVLPWTGERREWAIYLALGTVFPAIVLALVAPIRWPSRWREDVATVCGAAFVLACGLVIVRGATLSVWLLAMTSLAALWRYRRTTALDTSSLLLVVAPLCLAGWVAAQRFVWWVDARAWGPRTIAGGAAVVVATMHYVFAPERPRDDRPFPRAGRIAVDVGALTLLALAAVRADRLFTPATLHHWTFIVGPAQLVRDGGWLLWDAPSQYGFLNMLVIAALPIRDIWQAGYVLNAALLFLSASFLYWTFRPTHADLGRQLFAVLVAVAAVFLMPGEVDPRTGPHGYPNVGPLRFIWCYALLAVLVWGGRCDSRRSHHVPILVLGSLAWVAGSLWSAESAVCCTAIWLPASVAIVWRWAPGLGVPGLAAHHHDAWRRAAWITLPAWLLAAAVGVIVVVYVSGLGHGPDWRAFVEYSASYASGFFALPIAPGGPIVALVLVFTALSAVATESLRRTFPLAGLAPAVGAWATVWSTASYFVSRSHPNNATNLTPQLVAGIGVALVALRAAPTRSAAATICRVLVVPFVAVVLIGGYGQIPALRSFGTALTRGYVTRIADRLPGADVELQRLAASGPMRPGESLTSTTGVPAPVFVSTPSRSWLPAIPFAILTPLPEIRRRTYIRRFFARRRRSGWLLVPNQLDSLMTDGSIDWLYDEVARTHALVRRVEGPTWTLLRYDDQRSGSR